MCLQYGVKHKIVTKCWFPYTKLEFPKSKVHFSNKRIMKMITESYEPNDVDGSWFDVKKLAGPLGIICRQ